MSASPNNHQLPPQPQPQQQSPPASMPEISNKVVVPFIQQHDEIYYYVFVKGSLYSSDSAVFGLEDTEIHALVKKFGSPCKEVENGVMIKKSVNEVINNLAQLGYRVVSSCGETETIFTLQREV